MKNKITDFVEKHNLIEKNDTVLIAFSGGADSVFLAHYLLSVKAEYNLTLKIAHVEHGIRGKESINDYEFSKKFAQNNNIDFFEIHIDALNESKKAGIGVEEYSRNRRYEFFNTIKCSKIATAHNLTDNIETMIFRIARGTSVHGLCSIPVQRDKIIRPLLCVSGEEIRSYCDTNSIKYCVDSTNSDNAYSRNYIRNTVIPQLKQINSEFIYNASRLLNNVNETENFLKAVTVEKFHLVCNDNKLSITALNEQDIVIKKRIIVKYFSDNDVQLDETHLNGVLDLLNKQGRIQIKGNVFAISDNDVLRIARFDDVDFEQLIVNKQVQSINTFLNNCELLEKKFDFYCDYDKIDGNVQIRKRLLGDKISLEKRKCTKSLKKLFNEYHIPVEQRSNIPVLYDNSGIIGVYGYCKDSRVSVDETTRNVLIIDVRMDMEDNN